MVLTSRERNWSENEWCELFRERMNGVNTGNTIDRERMSDVNFLGENEWHCQFAWIEWLVLIKKKINSIDRERMNGVHLQPGENKWCFICRERARITCLCWLPSTTPWSWSVSRMGKPLRSSHVPMEMFRLAMILTGFVPACRSVFLGRFLSWFWRLVFHEVIVFNWRT